ncbi:MAG: 1-acyl-sn-glycerol-3-phosphate acyltransferase [Actinobacteria bacterium]|nr:1-acyl-sn-glycerol-3-phosphate acyltransferase [Actinomycetota bacterium]
MSAVRPETLYLPPQGDPPGTNPWFRFGAAVIKPILNLIIKKDWKGAQHLPKSGPVIVVCNHLSYIDPLTFTHFLYNNGRAPRYLGKESVFRIPIIGRVISGTGQIPVSRESKDAVKGLEHAIAVLKAGHLLGVYPEGTLTRDENLWPMKAKTGVARLALITGAPVIPCASWGPEKVLPPYSKKLRVFPRSKVSILMGAPVDLSPWHGKSDDLEAVEAAVDHIMDRITELLEILRGESAPAIRFDPKGSDLPRIGNFKKAKKAKE